IECNPEDITIEKLRVLKKAGFNRLSIGIQSFIEGDLKYLQRGHSVNQSLEAVSSALEFSFSNLNVDFIIGLPTQNEKSLDLNFSHIERFNIPHVSCYLLENVLPSRSSEESQYILYNFTRKRLKAFIHYEVSNFCRPGFECSHNLKYWKNQDYIGIGLAASGYENETDYQNLDQMDLYIDSISQNKLPVKEVNTLNPVNRKIVAGLRLLEGVSLSSFQYHKKELEFLLTENLLIKVGKKIAVNPEKILLLNEILAYFI
ncbi:MAG: radical SAM protein, partial [Candidatus Aminicenantes bacterium]|nr:radical SAM protein [Candidatus Aminicenantes bacterium]